MSEYEIQQFGTTAEAADTFTTADSGETIFRHSKKRHERRTNTVLHIVLVCLCLFWLLPFIFLICQSGRSFAVESGGMVNYVWPQQGFKLDNYKGLFIKNFSAKDYQASLTAKTIFENAERSGRFSKAEKDHIQTLRDYIAGDPALSEQLEADTLFLSTVQSSMKAKLDAEQAAAESGSAVEGALTEAQKAAYEALLTPDRMQQVQKNANAVKLDDDFHRDFSQGFLPWWLATLAIAACTALVLTAAVALLRKEAGESDGVNQYKWLILFGILQLLFIVFLLVTTSIRKVTFEDTAGVAKVFIGMFLFLGFGMIAAYAYMKHDVRLLKEIPGYPKESTWDKVKQLLFLFLELTALVVVLLCYLQPNDNSQYVTWYGNTLTIALFVAVIQTVIILSVSYALSRIRFKGRKLLMNVVLVLGMFPGFLTMVVLYFLLRDLNLTGTNAVPGLILIYCASSGMGYYISKGFFDTIPKSLDESARIDGATRFQVFLKIIMPLAKPIVIYTILMAFMAPWGDYVFASLIAFGEITGYNVAVGLYRWINVGDYQGYFTLFCAGGVLVAVPITALFLALQKYYVEGVTGGAVKG